MGLLELIGAFEFRGVVVIGVQRAAVLHEKSLRPPWQPKKPFGAYLTGMDEDEDGAISTTGEDQGEEGIRDSSATGKWRTLGVDPSVLGNKQDSKPLSEDALKMSVEQRLHAAKQRSFCAGCHRRGHWHAL